MASVEVKVPGHRRLRGGRGHRGAGQAGRHVKAEQSLVTVETDKASMEIPSGRRRGEGAQGQARRQGQRRARCCWCWKARARRRRRAAAPRRRAARRGAQRRRRAAGCRRQRRRPRRPAPPAAGAVEVACPTSATSTRSRSSRCWSSRATRSRLEQSLITVETDKASMEIPSSHAGVVKELKVKVGDKVNRARSIAVLEGARRRARPLRRPAAAAGACAGCAGGARAHGSRAARRAAERTLPTAALPAHEPTARRSGTLPHASPSVRKFARELGVPLDEVKGSGPKGRITQEDVQAFVKARDGRRSQHQGAGGARRRAGGGRRRGARACCPGRRSTSPSSARSSARTCRASRRSAAPTCTATG